VKIAIATSNKKLPDDDRALAAALKAKGCDVLPVIWSETNHALTEFDAVVVRSCWDYHLRVPEFLGWIRVIGVLEVIDDDAFAWFMDHGGMTRENGQRFRELVLARAGTEDAAAMYRHFRGRDAALEPLLQQRGLVSHTMKPSRNL